MEFKDLATILIALFALGISIISFGHQWLNSIQTWKIAEKANDISRKANETAEKALAITEHDHKAKYLPNLEAYCGVMVLDIDNEDEDVIMLYIRNLVFSDVTIKHVAIGTTALFEIEETSNGKAMLPRKALFNNPVVFICKMKRGNGVRDILVNKIKRTRDNLPPSGETLTLEIMLENQIKRYLQFSPIQLYFIYENKHFSASLSYSEELKVFKGENVLMA
jgi:hypothetical protein